MTEPCGCLGRVVGGVERIDRIACRYPQVIAEGARYRALLERAEQLLREVAVGWHGPPMKKRAKELATDTRAALEGTE